MTIDPEQSKKVFLLESSLFACLSIDIIQWMDYSVARVRTDQEGRVVRFKLRQLTADIGMLADVEFWKHPPAIIHEARFILGE